ncbi:inversin isoform X2 [Stegostoma tigrinum]|uniref:inversin isoform X2 n=1 Tax=Stegostoma tigrinum TaxID=3053191 RepID=UPI00286FAF27|nr:inversin isoform X2 [Stegostoma tigrinum]
MTGILPRSDGSTNVTENWLSNGSILTSQVHAAAVNGDKCALHKLITANPNIKDAEDQFGRTPLMYCVLADRLDCAEALIKAGVNINKADHSQRTALHLAAQKGNYRFMKLLLSRRANWMQKDLEEMTPLHLATRHKSPKCLALLLKSMAPGEVDTQDKNKQTALHWSAYYNHPEHVKLLIKHDSNIGIPDIEGKIPLHWAASNKDTTAIHTVKCILEAAPTESLLNWQDYEGRTPLHFAVADGNDAVVDVLTLYEGCNITSYDNLFRTPLHWAALLGHAQIGHLLLERNKSGTIPSDSQGATPLHYAAQSNFAETVEVFLNHPSVKDDPDLEGRTAFMWAAGKGSDDVLRTMLRVKSDIDINMADKYGGTALHAAVLSGHVRTVKLLLKYGAQVDAMDVMKHTPLFRACEMGHKEVIHTLIEGGARVDLLDQDGHSPLHWAALGGNADVCQILIQNLINPNMQDYAGRTPLQCAACGGYINCMAILMENKADPNIQDKEGRTALHWSCNNGYLEAVKLLLGYSAFPNHMEINEERFTPLDYALLGEHQEVIQYMLEHGALSIAAIQDIAASKIQAVYKGYMVRKAFQERKNLLMKHEQLRKDAAKKREEENKRKEAEIQKEKKRLESEFNVQQGGANLEINCQLADHYPVNGESTSPTISEQDQLELRTRKDFKKSSRSKSEKTATIRPLLQTWRSIDTIQSHTSSIETGKRELKNGKELTRKSSKGNRVNDHHPYNEGSIANELQSCRQLSPSEKGDASTENDGRIPESARRSNGCKSKPAGFRSGSATKKSVKQQNPPPLICGRHHKITSESFQEYEVPWAKCSRFSPAGSSRPGSAKSVTVNSTDNVGNAMQTSTQCSDTITSVLHPRACPKSRNISGMYNYAIENAPRDRTGSSQSPSTDKCSFTTLNDRSSDIQLIPLEIRVQIVEKERLRKELFRKKNKAAAVIQRAWKSYRIRKTLLLLLRWRCQNGDNVDKTWKQEVAAFTIQLVWRKNLSGSALNGIPRKSSQTFNSKSSCTRAAKQHSVLKQIYGKPQEEKGHNSQQSPPFRNGHISVQKMSGAPVKGIFRRVRSACSTSLSSTYHSQLSLDLTTFNGHTHWSKLQHVQLLGNTGNSKQFSYNMRPHTSKTSKARPKE